MAVISNTYKTYEVVGTREDLTDAIYDISPTKTPYFSALGVESMKQTYREWQIDELAAAVSTNRKLEGDDVSTFPALTPTTRIGAHAQIMRKEIIVSDTLEVTDKAGRKSERAYQTAKKSAELKRDIEKTLLSNQADVAGGAAVERQFPSLQAYLKTNTNFNTTDGADPTYTSVADDPRTDGTQRAFTEDMLKDTLAACWTSGAEPDTLMVGPINKQVVSTFEGIATQQINITQAKQSFIVGAADVYVSDFGRVKVIPNRFQRERDAFVLDTQYAKIMYLRRFKTQKLAKTGDAEKWMLIVELSHKVNNEAALGAIYDLNDS